MIKLKIIAFTAFSMVCLMMVSCDKKTDTPPSDLGADAGTVTDYDGNVYNVIKMGKYYWLKENLKTTHYDDGTPITNITSANAWVNLTTGAYCNYNDDVSYADTYGRLYSWLAVTNTHKLAPAGFHVATDIDWLNLTNIVGGQDEGGNHLKEAGVTHWASPNKNATNPYNFTALPGGFRDANGLYQLNGKYGYWWTSTAFDANTAWVRNMGCDVANVDRYNYTTKVGFAVRCVKNF